ncbi:hypothetical protein NE235_14220 [Actinoallomurus spadix]|uniref:Uncharacterized protein n=1 Tax=Actinoallomurus spadix TaxID=79912 RepID=A0ABN0WEH2_9ACTN|nr:hypothetical protein [Actinoallomurus spadix]MCO5987259.1 hypothetical protein [Actinoallomurus spadix]
MSDIDERIIEEFRANAGQVGGQLAALKGEERDRTWATVVQHYPVFGDYEKTAGIRTIPVVELTRVHSGRE